MIFDEKNHFLLMNYSDEQLRQRYRFGRNSIMFLADFLRDKIEEPTRHL
jgi:hypothetical protein